MRKTHITRTKTVPCPQGGLNRRDVPTRVEEDQITAGRNLWYHQGVLQTRPGTVRVTDTGIMGSASVTVQRLDDTHVVEYQTHATPRTAPAVGYVMTWEARLVNADGTSLNLTNHGNGIVTALPSDSLLFFRGNVSGSAKYYAILRHGEMAGRNEQTGVWTPVSPTVPLVAVNGKCGTASVGDFSDPYQSFNLLCDRFAFSATSAASGYYWKIPGLTGERAERFRNAYRNNQVQYGYRFTYYDRWTHSEETWERPLGGPDPAVVTDMERFGIEAWEETYSYVKPESRLVSSGRIELLLTPCDQNGNPSPSQPSQALQDQFSDNNLVFEVAFSDPVSGVGADLIGGMTQTLWFGGDSTGTRGGTRLFVTGNPACGHWVYWSSPDDPTYFPEENGVAVGDSGSAVTALGRQEDLLIVLKPRETLSAKLTAGQGITYDEALAGVKNPADRGDKLPTTVLSATVGCDCPASVRSIHNRLVWAHTDGHVYALTGVNSYTKRNVRCLSAVIEPLTVTATCYAGEYQGRYLLVSGTDAYLLDADNSAFISFSYYTREDRAQRLLPWFQWDFSRLANGRTLRFTVSDGEDACLCFPDEMSGGALVPARYRLADTPTDNGAPISASFTGRFTDFGCPEENKSVPTVYATLHANEGTTVRVFYLTDNGVSHRVDTVTGAGNETLFSPLSLPLRRFSPRLTRLRAFGVRMEAEGPFAVGDMRIRYVLRDCA